MFTRKMLEDIIPYDSEKPTVFLVGSMGFFLVLSMFPYPGLSVVLRTLHHTCLFVFIHQFLTRCFLLLTSLTRRAQVEISFLLNKVSNFIPAGSVLQYLEGWARVPVITSSHLSPFLKIAIESAFLMTSHWCSVTL